MYDLAIGSACYGCGACFSSCPVKAIEMKEDEKGFKYPSVNGDMCISCGKCSRVCRLVHEPQRNEEYLGVFAFQHKDKGILDRCSSGGAFIALSDYIIDQKGIIFGAVYDRKHKKVVHILADNREDRDKMCGSKYVQSDISEVLEEAKREVLGGRKVLFSGTPCQISALNALLGGKEYNNLITVDVMCHGAPSPMVFKSYIEYAEKIHGSKVADYQFRSKIYGYEYTTKISFDNGDIDSSVYAKRLIKLYTLNMRDSCYSCEFASKGRVSDITIGDLWRRPKNVRVKYHLGVSTVLVNTIKGKDLFDKIKNNAEIIPISINVENRQALSHPVKKRASVEAFWDDFNNNGIDFVINKYAKVSFRSKAYFQLIKYLHKARLNWLIEKIRERISIS